MASAAVHAACEKRDVDLALDLLPAIEPGPAAEAAFANVQRERSAKIKLKIKKTDFEN